MELGCFCLGGGHIPRVREPAGYSQGRGNTAPGDLTFAGTCAGLGLDFSDEDHGTQYG